MVTVTRPEARHGEDGHRLTDREIEILERLPTRLSVSQIASLLGISPNTVKNHLRHIYIKLGVNSRNEAVRMGSEKHLCPSPLTGAVGRAQ
jgi:DNA-binding CsgD family transcriptional regulator